MVRLRSTASPFVFMALSLSVAACGGELIDQPAGHAMVQSRERGFEALRQAQAQLGRRVRDLLVSRGFPSVAAAGCQAPGVVVSYTDDDAIHTARAFVAQALQTAGGVPLQCGEPADFKTFRIGLFGLDKLSDIDRTVGHLARALDAIQGAPARQVANA